MVPPTHNILLGNRLSSFWIQHAHGADQTEVIGYLGLLTIALAVVWLVVAVRRWSSLGPTVRIATAGLVAAFVAALAFAAPSPILLFGHKVQTPARLMFEVVPAFRVLSRWDAFLMTALVPLAAFGLQAGWATLTRSGKRRWLAVAMVGAAMVVSFFELTLHPARHRWRTVPVPAEYSALDQTPRGILAEYPLGYSDVYRIWQMVHGRPLVNGAPPDSTADSARLVLLDPTQPGTAQSLALLGVTAIGIHPGAHVDAEVLPGDPATDKGYRLIGRFPDGASIWDVVAPSAAAFVTLPAGFAKPMRVGAFVGYPFVSTGGVGAIDLQAKEAGVVTLSFDAVPPKGAHRELRLADQSGEQGFTLNGRVRISVLVDVPRGHSRLLVKIDPPPTSVADAVLFSAPQAERASGQPVLHAQLLSPDPGF